ncbi:MAG TPA: hypothetical protein VFL85_03770 [Candidatus Saccharimonadales bacterium]|nr:hypothetical protein [Candidatus Saccharimonadales bacterium]
MNVSISLLIFLLIDAFIMGVLAATALRHGYAHFRPHEPEKPKPQVPQGGHLPPAVREQLLAEAQKNFQKVLDRSALELQQDLSATTTDVTKKLQQLGSDITAKELDRYHAELDKLRTQAEAAGTQAQDDLSQHQAELKAKLDADMAAEKERLSAQIDTKLADAVASFLLETLQHDVDLGAQTNYLTKMLDEHKADFTRKVKDEV